MTPRNLTEIRIRAEALSGEGYWTHSCTPTTACNDVRWLLKELDVRIELNKIGELAIKSRRLELAADAHAEDAEDCGYSNDPTGSLHVGGSYRRAQAAEKELCDAIDPFLTPSAAPASQ
jgi:hypothetical protein